jgi:DNA-binding CsgD family transcriptional regulator
MRAHLAEGLDTRAIAALHGVSERTVNRARARIEAPRAHPPLSQAELDRANLLADEGMPATWIAEDLGRNSETLRRKLRRGVDAEWLTAWASIRHDEDLRRLHYEFAPAKH